jgi:hypothetical protein
LLRRKVSAQFAVCGIQFVVRSFRGLNFAKIDLHLPRRLAARQALRLSLELEYSPSGAKGDIAAFVLLHTPTAKPFRASGTLDRTVFARTSIARVDARKPRHAKKARREQ